MTIYAAISGVLVFVAVGLILLPVVLVSWFALTIVAAVKASNGEYYEYPFTMQFVS
jgi:uncharacterized Tic20 family protein